MWLHSSFLLQRDYSLSTCSLTFLMEHRNNGAIDHQQLRETCNPCII
uniref:Uncharacterized protein n=1 Tax=Arundo donax TaxID=35708 RepID=A0A0A8XUX0_ARUDO